MPSPWLFTKSPATIFGSCSSAIANADDFVVRIELGALTSLKLNPYFVKNNWICMLGSCCCGCVLQQTQQHHNTRTTKTHNNNTKQNKTRVNNWAESKGKTITENKIRFSRITTEQVITWLYIEPNTHKNEFTNKNNSVGE